MSSGDPVGRKTWWLRERGKRKKKIAAKRKNPDLIGIFFIISSDLLLHRFHKFLELFWKFNRQLTQDFSVKSDFLVRHFFDECGILFAVHSQRGVETQNPKTPKSSFLVSAIPIGVFSSLEQGFFGGAVMRFSSPHKALGLLQDFLSSFGCDFSAFDS